MNSIISVLESIIGVESGVYTSELVWIAGAIVFITVYSVFRLVGCMFSK